MGTKELFVRMNRSVAKKRFIIKNRLWLLTLSLIAIALIFIFSLSVSRNLLADYYYQKYINAKIDSSDSHRYEYIIKALSLNETNPEYLFELGKSFYEANKEEYAAANLDSSRLAKSNENKLWLNAFLKEDFSFVKDYKNIGNPKMLPIAVYEESIHHNPLNAEAYFKLGLAYAILEHTDNVDSLFKMAAHMDPNNTYLRYRLGIYYLWNQNLEDALEAFGEIFAISSSAGYFLSDYFLNILNHVYLLNFEYNTLAKICTSSYRAYLLLAEFLEAREQWDDSKRAFYRAIKLAPLDNKGKMIYKFAVASASNQDWQEIKNINERFKHCISSDNKINRQFIVLLVRCHYSQKDYEEVIRKAKLAIDLDPYDYQAYYYKGLSLLQLGRKKEGLCQLEKAVELSPENIDLHTTLASSYESAKQINKALNEWQLIMKLSKTNSKNEKFYTHALNNIVRIKTRLKGVN